MGLGVLEHAINSKTKIRPVRASPWSPPISLSHIREKPDLLCVERMLIWFCTLEIDSCNRQLDEFGVLLGSCDSSPAHEWGRGGQGKEPGETAIRQRSTMCWAWHLQRKSPMRLIKARLGNESMACGLKYRHSIVCKDCYRAMKEDFMKTQEKLAKALLKFCLSLLKRKTPLLPKYYFLFICLYL